MIPSLYEGDVVAVSGWEAKFGEIERGDIVVFTMSAEVGSAASLPASSDSYFVKRVVGLPGDEITIRDGFVHVGGELLNEPYARGETWVDSFEDIKLSADGGGFVYNVPFGGYFVLGDNRVDSVDSRNFVRSFVWRGEIVGVVVAPVR